ncbi:MAG: TetR/AcrR family transcriptional regulator [Deltaproteobacteria bacterium]|nr:TetR/AcrR family transcriptional regulator [Deltaproteobacteria bacterium]
MRKGEATRARLVAKTAELLQRQGFHATGLAQIVAESGSPRGSVYFHFPGGKEELACAALSDAGKLWRERLEAVIGAAPHPSAAVRAVCSVLASAMEASEFREGCPLATVALEAASSSERVRATIASHYAGWESLIAARVVSLGMAKRDAARLATFTLATLEGALMLAKVKRDATPIRDAGEQLARLAEAAGAFSKPRRAPPKRRERSAARA